MRARASLFLFGFGFLLASGCGSNTMAPVKGRVTCDGQPVAGAHLIFAPVPESDDDREPGKPATGLSEADGNYALSTYRLHDGARVGKHEVTVTLDDTNPARCERKTVRTVEVKPGSNVLAIELKE
jgi:hypothetical protein